MAMRAQPLEFEKPLVDLLQKLSELKSQSTDQEIDLEEEIDTIQNKIAEVERQIYENLSPWQKVLIARHTQRPYMLDYIGHCFEEFIELHGDRRFGDDRAMPGGLATIDGIRCVVLGHQKGRDTKENLMRNFGSAHPEGYRKALRLMRLAEKFHLPIVTLIDTPGAYPGVGAEERHIAEAIAVNLREMMLLKTPIVSVVIGEGGSGGALGIGIADRLLMLEHAYYSVISPEGCAAILWKDRQYAPDAAQALKLTSQDLLEMEIVDEIVPEPTGGAHHHHRKAADFLKKSLVANLQELIKEPLEVLLEDRYQKYRRLGEFLEN